MIKIKITDRIARTVDAPHIICGNSDYTVAFEFDAEWSAYPDKTAVFSFCRGGERVTLKVPFKDVDSCYVPVISGTDMVEIGCCAGNIRTTSPARIPCCACITDIQSDRASPQQDIYNDIMEQITLIGLPVLEDDEYFVMTLEGDYVITLEGDYVIARE